MSAPFQAFVAPARHRPQLWRLVAGLLLALVVYVVTTLAIFGGVWLVTPDPDPDLMWVEQILEADTPRSMLILLATFTGMALGPMAAARLLHRRGAGTLFGRAPVVLRDFVIGTAVAGGVLALSLLLWSVYNDAERGLPPQTWLAVLPAALVGIAIQTGAEEVLFRGYLQQQLAARFRSPLVWAALPALIFGFLHFDPRTAGENAPLVVASAALFGLLAADLTARTGSIGAAWGFHFANNTLALTVIATEGTLTGLALYRTPYDVADAAAMRAVLPLDLAMMAAIWLLLRRLLAR